MNFTKDQERAISARGKDVLVAAAAGSGKTAVLTERVCRLIASHQASADGILVVTFTTDAANEMKQRIAARLNEHLEEQAQKAPGCAQARYLQQQAEMLMKAHIGTIHSFCMRIVRTHGHLVGLPGKDTAPLDELSGILMQDRILEKLIDHFAASRPVDFGRLVGYFHGMTQLKEYTRAFCQETSSFAQQDKWQEQAAKTYLAGVCTPLLEQTVSSQIEQAASVIDSLVQKFERLAPFGVFAEASHMKAYRQCRTAALSLAADVRTMGLETATEARKKEFPRTMGCTAAGKEMYDELKQAVDRIKECLPACELVCEQTRRMSAMADIVQTFVDFCRQFDQDYLEIKKSQGVVDFNDMEHLALQILKEHPHVAQEWKNRFSHVFVDEYQDVNEVQEQIIALVTPANSLYCVGDLKQSIYRFRNADPGLFSRRMHGYQNDPSKGDLISLTENFRSAQNVLDCANDVFSCLSDDFAEMEYGQAEALKAGRIQTGADAPVCIDLIPGGESDIPWINDHASRKIESLRVVELIKERVGKPIFDPVSGQERPCQWQDIAVIARDRGGFNSHLCACLQANDVPFVLSSGDSLTRFFEIALLEELLSLSFKSVSDIAVLSVVHNGLFGFDDQDMLAIRRHDQQSRLYANVCEIADGFADEPLTVKCRNLRDFVSMLRQYDSSEPVDKIIYQVIEVLDYRTFCASLSNPEQRLANLEALCRLARSFQKSGPYRLYGFLRALETARENAVRLPAGTKEDGSDAVHLMTIHGSKGMQYPVVIMPFIDERLEKMDRTPLMAIGKDLGLGMKYFDPDLLESGDLLWTQKIREDQKDKDANELLRLLYVAMTRAQEELYLVGSMDGPFQSGASRGLRSCGVTFQQWLLSVLNGREAFLNGKWQIRTIQPSVLDLDGQVLACSPCAAANQMPLPLTSNRPAEELVPFSLSASQAHTLLEPQKAAVSRFRVQKEGQPSSKSYDEAAASFGSAVHELLCQVDFSRLFEKDYLESAGQALGVHQMLTDFNAFVYSDLRDLFRAPQASLILNADRLVKERSCLALLPYQCIQPSYQGQEMVEVSCEFDLLCQHEGKWYLFDYKTDRFSALPGQPGFEQERDEKCRHHQTQLRLYAAALKKTCNIELEAAYLAFVSAGIFEPVACPTENCIR